MRIVYDLVTSLLFPSPLNAARRANADIPGSSGDADQRRTGRNSDPAPLVAGARITNLPVERLARSQMARLTGGMEHADQSLRTMLFMEAISILRNGDPSDPGDREDVEAHRPDLMIGDGIPLELQPLEITFGHRTAAHLVEIAERREEHREAAAEEARADSLAEEPAGTEAERSGTTEEERSAPADGGEPDPERHLAPPDPGQTEGPASPSEHDARLTEPARDETPITTPAEEPNPGDPPVIRSEPAADPPEDQDTDHAA